MAVQMGGFTIIDHNIMKKETQQLTVESVTRGSNLYCDYTIVRLDDGKALFTKDKDSAIFEELNKADNKQSIIKKYNFHAGNPHTEQEPKFILKPLKKSKDEGTKK